jgi:hypothetical protein
MQRIPESSKLKCVDGVCVNVAKSLHTQFEATKKKTQIRSFKRRSSYKPSKKLGPTIGINKRKNIERDQRASEGPK